MPHRIDSHTPPVLCPEQRAAVDAARQIVAAPEFCAGDAQMRVTAWHTLLWARGQRMNVARIERDLGLHPAPVVAFFVARITGTPLPSGAA